MWVWFMLGPGIYEGFYVEGRGVGVVLYWKICGCGFMWKREISLSLFFPRGVK